ncbi:GIY-YIG nuclease family protein [Bdellovibrio svalbardensis]|uniref:GIY-YIG nuclease family protein n=1 Tax=Bdellovibrio svalbardensis TaxID=2972972 RepID=A0ABT6DIX0_9BACT|nr:GIY-YIG nuclease family protein [Bdellovibrio svalbardensis]MDG0816452.1 GIY-YIG nuclease family protein [Bdellovibrio svalbardensis]
MFKEGFVGGLIWLIICLGFTGYCLNVLKAKVQNVSPNVPYEPLGFKNENDKKFEKLADYYIKDSMRYILSNVTANNFATSVSKIEKVYENCEKCGVSYPTSHMKENVSEIKERFAAEVKKAELKEQQARIKEQIREEQRAEKEKEVVLKRLENEQKSIERALEIALKNTNDAHSAEIEKLKAELVEAQAKTERTKSQAQLTKSGNVYVISNIGSFGEHIYKVGMTRRLEPYDRVDELGDASVPFPFDVHMMIPCDDAPALESVLHDALESHRLNKVNLRKEFFKVELSKISELVEKHHAKVECLEIPDAIEYRETVLVSKKDGSAA